MLVWSRTYGKVYSLTVGSSNIIILCDRKAVHALIDKKSAIYSDRPSDYVGWLLTQGDHMALHQMDKGWREMRKHIAHHFSPMQCDEHHQIIQESESRALMNDLLDTPELFRGHIRRTTSSISSIIVYGQRGPTIDHKYARQVYDVMERWTETMEPGANPPVDVFPILKLIPIRFAPWKQRALRAGKVMDEAWGGSLKAVRDRRATGEKRDCVADKILDDYEAKGDQLLSEHKLQNLLGEMVEGGSDTTSAQLLTFIMAMATYPRVQEKAHKLMDEVIGSSRSPIWADFDKLNYVNAMVKEGMRWRPVSSVALPHRAREDDTYDGMFIPKDSTVWVAVWYVLSHIV
jgi:cytochrome P450